MLMKKRVTIEELTFTVAYIFFVFYLYNRDVSNPEIFYGITEMVKYGALLSLTIGICCSEYKKRQIAWIGAISVFDIFVMFKSGVMTFVIITLFAILGTKIEDKKLFKVAFLTLLNFLIITILFCWIGIYQDNITNRYIGTNNRHSLGFYHSNVLPLVVSYMVGYYCAFKNRVKKSICFFILICAVILFEVCGSRNAFLITVLIVLCKLIDQSVRDHNKKLETSIKRFLFKPAEYSALLLFVISVGLPLMLKKIKLLSVIDYLFSYRLSYTLMKIETNGLHLLPQMSNEVYFADKIVVDNGYAFVAIRYGLIVSILLCIGVIAAAKYYKKNMFALMMIILVTLENVVDNDIIDYSCLPYLIIIEKCVIMGIKDRKKLWKT